MLLRLQSKKKATWGKHDGHKGKSLKMGDGVTYRECVLPGVPARMSKYGSNSSKADHTCPSSKSNGFDFYAYCQRSMAAICMRMRRILDDFLSVACNLCCHLFGFLLKASRFRVSFRWFSRLYKVLDKDNGLLFCDSKRIRKQFSNLFSLLFLLLRYRL